MKIIKTEVNDLLLIIPDVYRDSRGWFTEAYNKNRFSENQINIDFCQDNHSYSNEIGVLRGLHLQKEPYAQTKLVRCTKGRIWDVAVDLRKGSSTYLKWLGIELTDKNMKMLLIPKGFAHGFITLEKDTEVMYKVDQYYNKDCDISIRFDDPEINIKWPDLKYIVSEKDEKGINLSEYEVETK